MRCRHLQCQTTKTTKRINGSSRQRSIPRRQKCSSIFNAKPTGPDHPLRFSMALPLRPSQPRRFIHQKLHANQTKMFKHLRCEAHQTRSAVEVQHGSSPDAVSPAALHPSKASPKSDKNAQASSTRSPPDYRSPVGVQHGSSLRPSMRSPPDQISRWGSVWLFTLPLRPYHGSSPQAISPAGLHASSMRSPPDQLRRWRSARFISYQSPSCPAPRFARRGESKPLLSLNCHLGHGRKKSFYGQQISHLYNQIENRPPDRQLPQLLPQTP